MSITTGLVVTKNTDRLDQEVLEMATSTEVRTTEQLATERIAYEEDADAAFKAERGLIGAIGRLSESAWDVARWAYECDEAHVWIYLADGDFKSSPDQKKAWLAQPDIGMSESWFNGLVQIHRDLVRTYSLTEEDLTGVDPTKATVILPAVKGHRVSVQRALADARALSRSDLRIKYAPTASHEPAVTAGSYRPDETDGEPEHVAGEVLEPEDKLPGWVTRHNVEKMLGTLRDEAR